MLIGVRGLMQADAEWQWELLFTEVVSELHSEELMERNRRL